ncbi:uncharacterized protein ARMOST_21823 [Armillaria ostoyae]|uniref:Uncharacterized protein n=1 Tax=Armillaria ostoyae TaxID=47428 RepID=A0A284SB51_ARMOS|nr:uncharacterized protein ARMOST_21823 [Armillaria ostoyae]
MAMPAFSRSFLCWSDDTCSHDEKLAPRVLEQFTVEKGKNTLTGGGNQDCMSFPIKGHESSDPKARLKLDELIAEIRSTEIRLHDRAGLDSVLRTTMALCC